jgi:hypothetical protein
MTLQQTVTIPADRRLRFDFEVPETLTVGEAEVKLVITPKRTPQPHRRPFEGLFGCAKGSGVWDGDGVEIIRKLRDEW